MWGRNSPPLCYFFKLIIAVIKPITSIINLIVRVIFVIAVLLSLFFYVSLSHLYDYSIPYLIKYVKRFIEKN